MMMMVSLSSLCDRLASARTEARWIIIMRIAVTTFLERKESMERRVDDGNDNNDDHEMIINARWLVFGSKEW
jgi:predicted transcriptional regulator